MRGVLVQNPLRLYDGFESQSISRQRKAEILALGHDGVFGCRPDGTICEIAVFHPTQIKSAIGNSGAYNSENPDITDRIRSAETALDFLDSLKSAHFKLK